MNNETNETDRFWVINKQTLSYTLDTQYKLKIKVAAKIKVNVQSAFCTRYILILEDILLQLPYFSL